MSPSIISSTGKKYLTNPGRSIPLLLSCMQHFLNWLKIQKLGLMTITLPPPQGRAHTSWLQTATSNDPVNITPFSYSKLEMPNGSWLKNDNKTKLDKHRTRIE